MRNTSYSLLVSVGKIIEKSGGFWSKASQQKYTELLAKIHNVNISKRTVRYHLLNQTNQHMVRRYRRWKRASSGRVNAQTTAICLTVHGYKYLLAKGFTWAGLQIKRLNQKYGKNSDGAMRPPGKIPGSSQEIPPKKGGKNPYADPAHRKKMGLPPNLPFKPDPA